MTASVSIVIATCGSDDWSDLAWSRAYPSADAQEGRGEIVVEHYPDLTVSAARNAAAAHASGDVLVFLDADDELAPGYLTALRPLLEPQGVLIVEEGSLLDDAATLAAAATTSTRIVVNPAHVTFTSPPCLGVPAVSYVYPDGRATPPGIPQKGRWPELNECVIGTAVSRTLFREVGGFREYPALEDYDLWLRCFDAGARLVYVPDAVYCAHVHAGSRNADQTPYAEIWADHLARVSA